MLCFRFISSCLLAPFSRQWNKTRTINRELGRASLVLLNVVFLAASLSAQSTDAESETASGFQRLQGNHPAWASAVNDAGPVAGAQSVKGLTIVVARTAQQEADFARFLADQQNAKSADYHQWLTPAQIADRFGPSAGQASLVAGWLAAQGLHLDWTAPSRAFIGFSGSAAAVNNAFHMQLHSYVVHGQRRMAPSAEPQIPASLAGSIRAVRGLFTMEEAPQHMAQTQTASPELTVNGSHYLSPEDFNLIYNNSTGINQGFGQTIGIVGRSRTDLSDFQNFQSRTGYSFSNPTEVVPTAYGGVDPGPAYTAPPASDVDLADQLEATLDVLRAGSVAPAANLLLVVATGDSGGIGVDTQYLVQTTPLPATVINISFGSCEAQAGASGVSYWDSLFQQEAAEGISVFVSSGDSGASGCDQDFTTPPATPNANSPNYICSSSYATCVGGTEFNDTANPGQYWSSTNDSSLSSALGYIPEGAWNEPLNSKSASQIAASGGGVSSIIATPGWQTGTGVPSARAGRYTPDLAFSASGHDGYFACFAAAGASCVPANDGSFQFEIMYGTSAAAPSMAGVTAILDQKLGAAQGNLNPQLYPLAARTTDVFHDTTVSSSGVSNCQVATPSMCNNSAPGVSGLTGGQPGYAINTGYDEVTGLGSLNVGNFISEYTPAISAPMIQITADSSITSAQDLAMGLFLSGVTNIVPTGIVTATVGSYSSGPQTLANGYGYINVPAGSLSSGKDTVTVSYTPDTASALVYSKTSTPFTVNVTAVAKISPPVYVGPASNTTTTTQTLQVTLSVDSPAGDHTPTGTVRITSGSYTSAPATLNGDNAQITIPVEALAVGTDTLTGTYTPDAGSASVYTTGTGTATVTVTAGAPFAPTVDVAVPNQPFTIADSIPVSVSFMLGSGYPAASGTVTLSAGSYTSSPADVSNNAASFTIPAGTLPAGTTTITANYVPDAASAVIYTNSSGTVNLTITAPPADIALSATGVTVKAGATSGNTSTVTITPSNGFTGAVSLAASVTSSPTSATFPPTISFGSGSTVNIPGTSAGTTALTVNTTASSSGCSNAEDRRQGSVYTLGGTALAFVLFLGIPAHRRGWRGVALLFCILGACLGGLTACGGGSEGKSCPAFVTSGTTTGSYTVTVTGTSGNIKSSATFTLTVQ